MDSVQVIKRHLSDYRKLLKISPQKLLSPKRKLTRQKVLLVSPHPDDEVLMGALAIRLQNENQIQVINVCVSTGSLVSRKAARKIELKKSIDFLKWKNIHLSSNKNQAISELKKIIRIHKPLLIIAPHAHDHHPTHILTSQLVKSSLTEFSGHVAWSEYWAPQMSPNILVEIDEKTVLKQIKALEFHKGEVSRNPYHIRLVGWLMDNVRRGSEWLNYKGAPSVNMLTGQLYHLECYEHGKTKSEEVEAFAFSHHDLTDWLIK